MGPVRPANFKLLERRTLRMAEFAADDNAPKTTQEEDAALLDAREAIDNENEAKPSGKEAILKNGTRIVVKQSQKYMFICRDRRMKSRRTKINIIKRNDTKLTRTISEGGRVRRGHKGIVTERLCKEGERENTHPEDIGEHLFAKDIGKHLFAETENWGSEEVEGKRR